MQLQIHMYIRSHTRPTWHAIADGVTQPTVAHIITRSSTLYSYIYIRELDKWGYTPSLARPKPHRGTSRAQMGAPQYPPLSDNPRGYPPPSTIFIYFPPAFVTTAVGPPFVRSIREVFPLLTTCGPRNQPPSRSHGRT